MSRAQDNVEKVRASWGSDNDYVENPASDMDTVLFQTKEPTDFSIAASVIGDADTNIVAGTYGGAMSGLPTIVDDGVTKDALAPVSLMSINSKDTTNISQIMVDTENAVYVRHGVGVWKQMATMHFDGSQLNITL